MRQLAILLMCFTSACGAFRADRTTVPTAPTLIEEAYLLDGDFDEAAALLHEAFDTSLTVQTAFLLGDLLDAVGRPEEALEKYFAALSVAHKSGDLPEAATASAMAVTAIRDRVERFYEKLDRFMETLNGTIGGLPPEAWFQLLNLKFGLLRTRGETDAAQRALVSLGCPIRWKSQGPSGPWVWSTFDDETAAAEKLSWPATVDLGLGRGPSTVRDVEADTCFVSAENPDMPIGGVTWVKTTLRIPRATKVRMRLQTAQAATVRLGGVEVMRRDPRAAYISKVSWVETAIPAGNIDVTVKLAGDGGLPSFSLSLFDTSGRPVFDAANPVLTAEKTADVQIAPLDGTRPHLEVDGAEAHLNLTQLFARMKCALWWDDMALARTLYQALRQNAQPDSPILLLNMAELVGADPSLPSDLAYEQARSYLKRALEAEPRLWEARIGLADRELDEERMVDAISLLEAGRTLCPEEVSILRRQATSFLSYGWSAEAETAISRIEQLMPSACSTLEWRLAAARRRFRFQDARAIAAKSVECDVYSDSLLEELRRAKDFAGAVAEANRLSALQPRNSFAALEVAKSALAAGRVENGVEAFRNALRMAPSQAGLVVALSDALRATGDERGAAAVLDTGMSAMFAAKGTLLESRAALENQVVLSEYRLDGLSVIEAYQKESPEYDAAAVYVLDRAVYLVDEMGGIVMLVHSIAHLKTDEAVESHGELSVPSGARILRARTVKADGRSLEPQEVSGKDSLSMPDLEPGDFIEYEYILSMYPNQLFPGGFDTERFFFQDFETGFHRTEIVLVAPDSIQIQTDPRGNCPEVEEERKGAYRVLTWKTRNASPHTSEPLSPAAVEFLPSIRVTAAASWEHLFARIRDQSADKNRLGYPVYAAVNVALKGMDGSNGSARRRALYRWVTRNIEPSRDMFEEASHIIARKSGNRARAFDAMLQAAGYASRLVLVMPGGEDETPNAVPSVKQFYLLLVENPEDGLIDLSNEFVPYGFLPGVLRNRPMRYVDSGELSRTGRGAEPKDIQDVKVSMRISENGDATGRVQEVLRGALAGDWRAIFEKNLAADYQRLFQSAYLSSAIPGARLVRLNIQGLESPDEPLRFEYDIVVPNFATAQGKEHLYLKLPFATNFSKQSGGLPKRSVPLVLSLHVSKTVDMEIELPDGFHAVPVDSPEQFISREWGSARRRILYSEKKIMTVFTTEVHVNRVPADKYPEFLTFSRTIDRASDIALKINKLESVRLR